jgi:hypothetical protein
LKFSTVDRGFSILVSIHDQKESGQEEVMDSNSEDTFSFYYYSFASTGGSRGEKAKRMHGV